jgi:hypothetical protein
MEKEITFIKKRKRSEEVDSIWMSIGIRPEIDANLWLRRL